MTLDYQKIGEFIQEKRRQANLTQAELGERLGISGQSVSNWERGEALPDTGTLPQLALILNTSVDALLGGGSSAWLYRRRITVSQMRNAIICIQTLRDLLGADHFMFRTMADALDRRMNSEIEPAFGNERYMDAYIGEALLECVKNGDYVDLDDVRRHISNEKVREYLLKSLPEMGCR